jgi:hypothetical protein
VKASGRRSTPTRSTHGTDGDIGRRSCSGGAPGRRARGQHGARLEPQAQAQRGAWREWNRRLAAAAAVNVDDFGDRRDLRFERLGSRSSVARWQSGRALCKLGSPAHINTSFHRIHGNSPGSASSQLTPIDRQYTKAVFRSLQTFKNFTRFPVTSNL